ncbi:MAG: hypothetical protein VSS75_002170 [Candidatus Parabeggiatoa sp.]|nr:hypothetical protein [Candidatus Parabeggiatoa sp.]
MLRVSSEGSRFYKNRDARQKQRREASRLYKNTDARYCVETSLYIVCQICWP